MGEVPEHSGGATLDRGSVDPRTEAYHASGGPTGVLFCHGFAGSGLSVRPWAERIAAAGHTVSLPLLPGHGTRWEDLAQTTWLDWYGEVQRSFLQLRGHCSRVYVFGFSMGAALGLRLAARHGSAVAGLVLVNPSITTRRWKVRLLARLPILTRLIPTTRGIGGDIKKPGIGQTGYDTIPTRAAYELTRLWSAVGADLDRVVSPTLVYRSRIDHVVDRSSVDLLRKRLGVTPEVRVLENSFHVATLDHDAPSIFDGSLAWISAVDAHRGRPSPVTPS